MKRKRFAQSNKKAPEQSGAFLYLYKVSMESRPMEASLESVRQKLYRASVHARELRDELAKYYQGSPGQFRAIHVGPDKLKVTFEENFPTPKRFGLIMGDCLQCLRSSLDYLVWELVVANGRTPNDRLMFPIALTQDKYQNALVKQHRLVGVCKGAEAAIALLQPFNFPKPSEHPLAVLDELTNINKHRRVLLTNLRAQFNPPPLPFPHLRSKLEDIYVDGQQVFGYSYMALNEGVLKDRPIDVVLEALYQVIDKFLPSFEIYFPRALRIYKVSYTSKPSTAANQFHYGVPARWSYSRSSSHTKL